MKGTGEGQRVRGHIRERRLKTVSQERKRAMLDMPQLIEEWKDVSNPCPSLLVGHPYCILMEGIRLAMVVAGRNGRNDESSEGRDPAYDGEGIVPLEDCAINTVPAQLKTIFESGTLGCQRMILVASSAFPPGSPPHR